MTGGVKYYYVYDGDTLVYEMNGSGVATNLFGYGAGGLAQRRAGNFTYNYSFDPSGNVVQRHQATTNNYAGGPLLADFTTLYDGFGQQLGSIAANTGGQAAAAGGEMIGFAGQFGCWTDNETSMNPIGGAPNRRFPWVWMGHREYDPLACRFLTRDPIDYDGGINLYAYCGNNPINFVDPSGFDDVSVLEIFQQLGAREVWSEGLTTAKYASGEAVTFGLWKPSVSNRERPGYGQSVFFFEIARDSLITAATLGAPTAAQNAITRRLESHLGEAIKIAKLTPRQAAAAAKNPNLLKAFMGDRIDKEFKLLVQGDKILNKIFKVTPRFAKGPDVKLKVFKVWWDVTTKGQWQKHVAKYATQFGKGIPLFH